MKSPTFSLDESFTDFDGSQSSATATLDPCDAPDVTDNSD
jgi:hypothetical protein